MFKKMIIMVMAMAMIVAMSTVECKSADAVSNAPEVVPGIVGVEHIDAAVELDNRMDNGELEFDYTINMAYAEGLWFVYIEGYADEYWGQDAAGIYDHVPTEEEIDYLWSMRIDYEVLDEKMEELGF